MGIPIGSKYFLSQLSRNAHIRPEWIVNSLSIEASRERIHNAAVQQALQPLGCVGRYDQVTSRFEQRFEQLANPLRCFAFHLGCDEAAPSSTQFFGQCEKRLARNGYTLHRRAQGGG